MLHPYREASNIRIPLTNFTAGKAPVRELFSLLCAVSDWLEVVPCVYGSSQGKKVYLIFENAALLISDFWDSFGPVLGLIDTMWPVCAYGTAQNQETVCLSAKVEDGYLQLTQQSISGKSAEVLQTLCFQVECPDEKTAQNLAVFLNALNWKKKIAVIPWNRADFLKEQNLIELNSRSFFCYAGFDIASRQEDCLCSLDFSKRLSLWRSFLKEGLEPEEFEWLICAITEDTLSDRMEWELALQEALEQLHFRVINQEHSFELFDDKGKRLYFGVDCRRAAERSLMKILFPLNFL